MELKLEAVNQENIYKCIALKVSDDQKNFVAPNVYSIAESKVNPNYHPYVVKDGDLVVGFVMLDIDLTLDLEDYYWVPRLMIDAKYQGKGYGKKAMQLVVELLSKEPRCERIRLSYEPENEGARKFYKSLGFVETGHVLDEGEIVAELVVG